MGPTDSNPTPAPGSFSFALLRREDLPLLEGWLAAGHVSPWFGPPANQEQDPLGELDAVRRFIASLDGRSIGMIQIYRWSDFPENASVVSARVGEVGIDYLIGEADLIGQGIGPSMVSAFLTRETFARGDVMGVRVDVSEANQRSWRCLEKLGFRRDQEGVEIPRQSGPHFVYVRESAAVGASDAATVARVAALVRSAPRLPGLPCRVVAIDGPAGAGKSSLALRVARELGDAPVIHTDDFAAWDNQFGWYVRLIDQVLEPLASGSPARYQRYEWEQQQLAEWHELEPREFLIIEGVGASGGVLRRYLSATVWVQTDRAERLRRGLARDGQDALSLWEEWMRGEDEYLAAEHPDQAADLVVSGEAGAAVADPGRCRPPDD